MTEIQELIGDIITEKQVDKVKDKIVVDRFQKLHQIMQDYQSLYEKFNEQGRESSLTFNLWQHYVEDIELAMYYIAAERVLDESTAAMFCRNTVLCICI